MLLLFINGGLTGGATAPTFSYVILPVSFAFLIRYLNHGSCKDLTLFCVSSIFAAANPVWIYLIAIMAMLYLGLEMLSDPHDELILLRRLIMLILGYIAFNM
jgi:hypothetical protein